MQFALGRASLLQRTLLFRQAGKQSHPTASFEAEYRLSRRDLSGSQIPSQQKRPLRMRVSGDQVPVDCARLLEGGLRRRGLLRGQPLLAALRELPGQIQSQLPLVRLSFEEMLVRPGQWQKLERIALML